MYLFTIPILLFSNYFAVISSSETSSTTQKPSTRKFNHDHDNCVCFPGGQSLISDILSPHENGLERLVVYIYRDAKTNQVKVFLPSPEKQALIPNIPYSIGDVLQSVTTETVSSLIQSHPNASRPIRPDHSVPETIPIGLKWGTIEHTSPTPNYIDLQGLHPIHPKPATPSDNVSPHQQNLGPQPHNFDLYTQNLGPDTHNSGPQPYNLDSYTQSLGPDTHNSGPQPYNLDSYTQSLSPDTHNSGPQPYNLDSYTQSLSPHIQNLGPQPHNLDSYTQSKGPQVQTWDPKPHNLDSYTQNLSPNLELYIENLGPNTQNLNPHVQNTEPYTENLGPHTQNLGPYIQNPESYLQNLGPHTQNLGPHIQNAEHYIQNFGPHTQNLGPHTQDIEPYPQNMGSQTQNLDPHAQNLGPHKHNLGPHQTNIIYPNQINHPGWRNSENIDETIIELQPHEVVSGVPNPPYEPNDKKQHPVPVNPYEPNNPLGPYKVHKDHSQPNGPINHKTYKQDVFAPGTHGLLTFDQWFNKQMELFREAHSPQHIQTINTENLRSLIQQVLFENHMHIGSTGQITDSKGAPINLRNLELRPILIGNSVRYPHRKEGQHVNLPKHLPYLEGILITLVYPPKVLGVIPLGKTYVSQSGLDVSVTTPKTHIYYTAPNDNLESPSSVEYYYPSVKTAPSNVQSSYSTVTVSPANLISYTSVVESPSILNPYSSVIESPANILDPYSSVINSPSNLLNSYSSVIESPSSLINTYSNVISSRYPNTNYLYSSGITNPLENVYENPNILYPNVNVPNLSGNGVPYLTNSNYVNNGVLWGPQLSSLLQRRSNKPSKSPKHPKPSNQKQEPHKKSKDPKNTSKPAKDVKSPPKPKPSSRSYDSRVPRNLENYSPYSNPPIVEKWRPSSNDNTVPIYLPTQNFYSQPNKQLIAIPVNSINTNAGYPNQNTFSQSIPDSPQKVAIPINLSSNSDEEYSPGPNLKYQGNNQPQLVAYPISKYEDTSNNNWNYEQLGSPQFTKSIPDSYSPQGISENIPKILDWISARRQKWPPTPDSNTPGWPPAKPEHWSPDIAIRPGHEIIPGSPISSTPDTGYPYSINSNKNYQQNKPPGGQTRRYSMASVQGVIKSLINIVLQNLAQVGESRRKGGGPNGTVSNPLEKPGEEGDRPDFRIIGGSAATGSGSPLSNKGRSGIIR